MITPSHLAFRGAAPGNAAEVSTRCALEMRGVSWNLQAASGRALACATGVSAAVVPLHSSGSTLSGPGLLILTSEARGRWIMAQGHPEGHLSPQWVLRCQQEVGGPRRC